MEVRIDVPVKIHHAVHGVAIALSKGRILEESLPLLARAGIVPSEDPEVSRKLIVPTSRSDVSLVILRAQDVPTYVQHGAADLGIAGKDVLLEHRGDGLYQPLDLRIGRCRLVVATRRGYDWTGSVQRGARIRVASKYVNTAREHFAAKGMHVDLIKLYGSMELARWSVSPTRSSISSRPATRSRPTISSSSRKSCRSHRGSSSIRPHSSCKRDRVRPLIDAFAAAVEEEAKQ